MKNIKNLRDLEDLPIDSLSFKIRKKDDDGYRYNEYGYEGKIGNISMYKFADNLTEKNIGKSFDLTFSYFCKKVSKHSQFIFLRNFRPYRYDDEYYIIDENGLIQEKNTKWRRKRNLTYYSDDFEEKWRHKITKAVIGKERDGSPELYQRCTHKGCDHNNCSHKREDYELFTFKGWSKTFDTWSDPEYKKLRLIKRRKQIDSVRKKRNAKRETIDFHVYIANGRKQRDKNIAWTEQQEEWRILREQNKLKREKKEYEDNLVKIISHGFDPINSFRHKLKS